MVALQVENVIASSSLGKDVELVRLGSELEHAHYAGGRTPSVVVDLDGDGAGGRTGVVFGNGKLYVKELLTPAEVIAAGANGGDGAAAQPRPVPNTNAPTGGP